MSRNCRGGPPWPPVRGNTLWNLARPRKGRLLLLRGNGDDAFLFFTDDLERV